MNEKSRINLAVPPYQIHTPAKNEVAEENQVYVSQLQELARVFSSIKNSGIREYGINLMRELSKCENEEKAKAYALEMMS